MAEKLNKARETQRKLKKKTHTQVDRNREKREFRIKNLQLMDWRVMRSD